VRWASSWGSEALTHDPTLIDGTIAPGFEAVADVFRENFHRRGELGAALAVYRGGDCLVDIWGGVANRKTGAAWQRDTVVPVFSTTKGLAALAMSHAHARGLFDYDERVARYWPEFAQAGKGEITVRQLLGHQAGLVVIDEPLTLAMLADPERRDAALAKQLPNWQPGERHGYHAGTMGLYQAALLRRCDVKGRGVRDYFAEEIARPLGIDFWIGPPRDLREDRIARMRFVPPLALPRLPLRFVLSFANPRSLIARAAASSGLRFGDFSAPELWQVEQPSGLGIGEVRGIARAYAEFACGSPVLGTARATLDALERPAIAPRGGEHDLVMHAGTRFSLGFIKPCETLRFGRSDRPYGMAGAGGSFGFADPDFGIGYAYAPNRMGLCMVDDPRERALREAVYCCLEA
jgi:CubicO group peptidase (beta-lactamase class C family)